VVIEEGLNVKRVFVAVSVSKDLFVISDWSDSPKAERSKPPEDVLRRNGGKLSFKCTRPQEIADRFLIRSYRTAGMLADEPEIRFVKGLDTSPERRRDCIAKVLADFTDPIEAEVAAFEMVNENILKEEHSSCGEVCLSFDLALAGVAQRSVLVAVHY
jgi:hypothetical protein